MTNAEKSGKTRHPGATILTSKKIRCRNKEKALALVKNGGPAILDPVSDPGSLIQALFSGGHVGWALEQSFLAFFSRAVDKAAHKVIHASAIPQLISGRRVPAVGSPTKPFL